MALAVGLGAFGAHGLKDRLDAYHLGIWEKAVFYHFIHALGLLIVSLMPRIGVLDGFEFGMREQFNFGALAMDTKVRLLKGRLDVALDPGFQLMYAADGSPTYFQAPVLLGVNVWDWLSVVLSPGFAYATAASWPSKASRTVARNRGINARRRRAAVTTPRVPSLPVRSPGRW